MKKLYREDETSWSNNQVLIGESLELFDDLLLEDAQPLKLLELFYHLKVDHEKN